VVQPQPTPGFKPETPLPTTYYRSAIGEEVVWISIVEIGLR